MSRKGYLTSVEYKLLRTSLGFTQAQAAEFHNVQNVRTIKRWESGDSWVSELACDRITKLAEKVNWTIQHAVEQASNYKPEELEITLIVYPDGCYKKYAVGFEDLPNSVHQAMITRTYTALSRLGYKVGVVEMNTQDYFIYLAKNNLKDDQVSRSAWACDYRERLLLN